MDLCQGQKSGNLTEIAAVESSRKQIRDTVNVDVGAFIFGPEKRIS